MQQTSSTRFEALINYVRPSLVSDLAAFYQDFKSKTDYGYPTFCKRWRDGNFSSVYYVLNTRHRQVSVLKECISLVTRYFSVCISCHKLSEVEVATVAPDGNNNRNNQYIDELDTSLSLLGIERDRELKDGLVVFTWVIYMLYSLYRTQIHQPKQLIPLSLENFTLMSIVYSKISVLLVNDNNHIDFDVKPLKVWLSHLVYLIKHMVSENVFTYVEICDMNMNPVDTFAKEFAEALPTTKKIKRHKKTIEKIREMQATCLDSTSMDNITRNRLLLGSVKATKHNSLHIIDQHFQKYKELKDMALGVSESNVLNYTNINFVRDIVDLQKEYKTRQSVRFDNVQYLYDLRKRRERETIDRLKRQEQAIADNNANADNRKRLRTMYEGETLGAPINANSGSSYQQDFYYMDGISGEEEDIHEIDNATENLYEASTTGGNTLPTLQDMPSIG